MNTCYKKKHVLPAIIVLGTNKPENIDSFMFCSFHHLSVLQHENNGTGLLVWDAVKQTIVKSHVVFLLATADALGLVEIDGRVGHHGAHGCWIGCGMEGRHKAGSGHYFTAHLHPNGDNESQDFDFCSLDPTTNPQQMYQADLVLVMSSSDQTSYKKNWKQTGISKPLIPSGLDQSLMLAIPKCFTIDLMHLLSLNLGDLFILLWRGSFKCKDMDSKVSWDWMVLTRNTWKEHGQLVADSTCYFPAFSHQTLRNPAEKISSGYKATEYYLYLFSLGPAIF